MAFWIKYGSLTAFFCFLTYWLASVLYVIDGNVCFLSFNALHLLLLIISGITTISLLIFLLGMVVFTYCVWKLI